MTPPSGAHSPHDATTARLREALGDDPALLAFARAVVAQLGRALEPVSEGAAAERVLRVLAGAGDGERSLAHDPVLLAALFQNVDLLYQRHSPRADAVGALVMGALERLGERG